MTIEESKKYFKNIPAIYNKIETLSKVGLDYIKLDKLQLRYLKVKATNKTCKRTFKKITGNTIYILDEPTTDCTLRM